MNRTEKYWIEKLINRCEAKPYLPPFKGSILSKVICLIKGHRPVEVNKEQLSPFSAYRGYSTYCNRCGKPLLRINGKGKLIKWRRYKTIPSNYMEIANEPN